MNFSFFPEKNDLPDFLKDVIQTFQKYEEEINSEKNDNETRLSSDMVLKTIENDLEKNGFIVEKGKRNKIRIPVHIGDDKEPILFFEVDGWNKDTKVVIEVEAGRALDNHQFLKDIFEAAMMTEVDYLVIAVRNCYRGRNDYLKICNWLKPFFSTNRIKLELEGILLIGY